MATSSDAVAIRVLSIGKMFRLRGLLPGRPKGVVTALHDVNLQVPRGAIQGLIGPNGSGKSTLLRILATLLLPNTGKAFVAGHDVTTAPLATRRHIGFSTGEERSFYWRLTGRQNLEFYAALDHLPDASGRVAAMLDQLGLTGVADRSVSTYSQGMLRRLGLGRALLHEPPVLLLDEPARSLDQSSRDHLHETLRRLRIERGTAILIATHDLEEAAALCDAVTVLRAGQVVREITRPDREGIQRALTEAAP
jgi:ABC-2 type transport system ATP-binding protein